jgi:hypothetical protein
MLASLIGILLLTAPGVLLCGTEPNALIETGQVERFVDLDGDGIDDSCRDTDNDGIPDAFGSNVLGEPTEESAAVELLAAPVNSEWSMEGVFEETLETEAKESAFALFSLRKCRARDLSGDRGDDLEQEVSVRQVVCIGGVCF